MKSLITLLGVLFTAMVSVQATVITEVSFNEGYEQVSADALQPRWRVLNGATMAIPDSETGTMETVDEVTFARPDGTLVPKTGEFISPTFWNVLFNESYASRAEIQNGDYEISFIGGSLDGTGRVYSVSAALFPTRPPQLSKHSYKSLHTKPVSRPIRLVFRPFAKPEGATLAQVGIVIGDTAGKTVFSQFWLPSTTGSVVIPAGTFLPGASYGLDLVQLVYGPLPAGGELDSHTYSVRTHIKFTTSSKTKKSNESSDDFDEEEAAFLAFE